MEAFNALVTDKACTLYDTVWQRLQAEQECKRKITNRQRRGLGVTTREWSIRARVIRDEMRSQVLFKGCLGKIKKVSL